MGTGAYLGVIIVAFGLFVASTMYYLTRKHWHDQDESRRPEG